MTKPTLFPTFSASTKRQPRRDELQIARSYMSAIHTRMIHDGLPWDQAFARVTTDMRHDLWLALRFIAFDLMQGRELRDVTRALKQLRKLIDTMPQNLWKELELEQPHE